MPCATGWESPDTVTFINGQLASINLQIPTTFMVDIGMPLEWNGMFSISGNQLAYSISDTQETFIGPSTFTANLTGTVNAVIPEPSAALLGAIGVLSLFRRRR